MLRPRWRSWRDPGGSQQHLAMMLIPLLLAGPAAHALPDTDPVNAYGVDGEVRSIVQVGSRVWVAGRFRQIVEASRGASPEDPDVEVNLASFSSNGVPLDIELDLGGPDSIVHDLAVAPDTTTVFAAGRFGAHGAENLIAFDGLTGAKLQTYVTPPLYSVHDDGTTLWAGGRHLLRVIAPERIAIIVSASTASGRPSPQVFDIVSAPQGGVFIACRCGRLDGRRVGAFAHVRTNGAVERDWSPARLDTASVGRKVLVEAGRTYLSAGGSDYVQAVRTATGRSLWKTDTNGQAQALAILEDRIVIGGHWRTVQSYCQPRLAALDPATGDLDRSWTPAPNPDYAGVWALAVTGDGSLWAGGRFERLGADWARNGLACEYIDGDQTKPRVVGANAWARSLINLR